MKHSSIINSVASIPAFGLALCLFIFFLSFTGYSKEISIDYFEYTVVALGVLIISLVYFMWGRFTGSTTTYPRTTKILLLTISTIALGTYLNISLDKSVGEELTKLESLRLISIFWATVYAASLSLTYKG